MAKIVFYLDTYQRRNMVVGDKKWGGDFWLFYFETGYIKTVCLVVGVGSYCAVFLGC